MYIKSIFTVFTLSLAHTALADARIETDNTTPRPWGGLVYAQSSLGALGESELKRMVFYANRASNALQDLVLAFASGDNADFDKKNDLFKNAVERLADAGDRSGLPVEQVAGFFAETVTTNLDANVVQGARSMGGGLDLGAIFLNTLNTEEEPATNTTDFVAAINDAGAALTQPEPVTPPAPPVTFEVVAGPEPLPGANAEEREIVQRVVVNQGRWEIVAQQGDSLSEIAAAIYGSSSDYNIIFDANTAVLTDANTLEVDTVLVLPKP